MALFDSDVGTLEDALGRQAENRANTIGEVYAKKRRQSIAQQAHAGRLGAGVSNYQAGDLAAEEAGDIGDVYGDLASALGQVPIQDYASSQGNARKRQLAELIARLNEPSDLEEALSALGTAGQIGGTIAMFAA